MKVDIITQTCIACPSQWEGNLKDGRMFYARYRWGGLTIELSKQPTNDVYMTMGEHGVLIYDEQLGDGFDGVLGQEGLVEKMKECGFIFN